MAWIPKGAKPAGKLGSTKVATVSMRLKLPSYISTLLLWKSVTKRVLFAKAAPLYTELFPLLSTATMALLGSTAGFHPVMIPSSETKMKAAGCPETLNMEVLFATIPVGLEVDVFTTVLVAL